MADVIHTRLSRKDEIFSNEHLPLSINNIIHEYDNVPDFEGKKDVQLELPEEITIKYIDCLSNDRIIIIYSIKRASYLGLWNPVDGHQIHNICLNENTVFFPAN